jgi:hypothetical protein
VYYAIQVTTGASHTCNVKALGDLAAQLELQEGQRLTLVYAVPGGGKFERFIEFVTAPVEPEAPPGVVILHAEIQAPPARWMSPSGTS